MTVAGHAFTVNQAGAAAGSVPTSANDAYATNFNTPLRLWSGWWVGGWWVDGDGRRCHASDRAEGVVDGRQGGHVRLGVSETASFPVVPAGTYTFSLRATNASGTSGPSNAISLSVPSACSGAPLPPENFLAYKIGNTAHVVWEPSATGFATTGYVLQVTGGLTLTLPTNLRALSGAVPPGTYNLSVIATNTCGSSAATAVQTIVIP